MGVNLGPANPEPGSGNILEQIANGIGGIGQAIADGLHGVIGMIADALFGPGSGQPIVRISDGMTELNGRLDLMEDVSGYGGMILANHRRFTSSEYRDVPFDTQYGPHTEHSVEVDTANHRFVLSAGTWSINALLVTPATGIVADDVWHRATITSYYPDGREHMNQWLDWRSGINPDSFFAQVPLVVPNDDGYYVKVRFRAPSRTLLGGTDRTKFWVNRWDMRTDNNNVILNPGNGPDV